MTFSKGFILRDLILSSLFQKLRCFYKVKLYKFKAFGFR